MGVGLAVAALAVLVSAGLIISSQNKTIKKYEEELTARAEEKKNVRQPRKSR